MELMVRLAAGAVAAALCAVVLRRNGAEFAVLVALAAGLWIAWELLDALGQAVAELGRLAALAKLENQVVEPVVKVVGLSILTRVSSELCRSAGEGGIAALLEVAGTVLALAAALPLAGAMADLIVGMLV